MRSILNLTFLLLRKIKLNHRKIINLLLDLGIISLRNYVKMPISLDVLSLIPVILSLTPLALNEPRDDTFEFGYKYFGK